MSFLPRKMFCINRHWLFQYFLLAVSLDLGCRQGIRLMICFRTETAETHVTPTNNTLSFFANNTFAFVRNDFTSITLQDTSVVSSSKDQNDVTTVIPTHKWTLLDVNNFTYKNSQREYYSTSQMREQNKSEAAYEIREDKCLREKVTTFSGESGIIHVSFNTMNRRGQSLPYCTFKIVVSRERYVQATLDYSRQMEMVSIKTSEDPNFKDPMTTYSFEARYFPVLMSGTNQIFFRITMFKNISELKLRFTANEKDLRMMLPLFCTSPSSGYVTTWGFDDNRRHTCFMNASRTVNVPLSHVVMISFSYLDIHFEIYFCRMVFIELYTVEGNGTFLKRIEICINSITPALVLDKTVQVRFFTKICEGRGFKMIFTFHPEHEAPVKRDGHLWDCSVPHYSTFKQHLECNLMVECQGGEDEGPHCPYSSPECNGSVAIGKNCYVSLKSKQYSAWSSGSRECKNRGGNLASLKTEKEWDALKKIYQFEKSPVNMYIGLSTYDGTLPPKYKKVLVWSDGTVAYNYNYLVRNWLVNVYSALCFTLNFYNTHFLLEICAQEGRGSIPLCEFSVTKPEPQMSVLMPLMNRNHVTQTNNSHYVWCPDGHFTFDFLSCDESSQCGSQSFLLNCQTWKASKSTVITAMFICLNPRRTLHFSLVCDFRQDCPDGSDENFCRRDYNCTGFTCLNGQCVDSNKQCDVNKDCWDGSDEDCVVFRGWHINLTHFAYPPAVIDFDQTNDITYRELGVSDACPDTHFRCPPDGYCLPIYVRCNGVYDCPYHEDEEDCASYTCPGFYRCRASSVCVHADHMCDGRPQCPQHDDELFCELTCPQGCLCQGLAFVCSEKFNMQKIPAMRYLDASGSGMTTLDLTPSIYLVWLSLAACKVQVLSNLSLPNLQTLDLSDNLISWLDMSYFMNFENLRVLRLAGNPLQSLFTSNIAGHSLLTKLDVSRTLLRTLECDVLSSFSDAQVLNFSFSRLKRLCSDFFRYTQKLIELDIRGNDFKQIHKETLKPLTSLRAMHVSYYTLCCKEFLPNAENLLCFSPFDTLSSCGNILRSKSLNILIWILFVLSFVGNICCGLYTLFVDKKAVCFGFRCLMINLNISDLVMGIYLLVIGIIGEVYRDRYVWHEQSWTSGYFCQIVGLLYFLSFEVSILTLLLMTIERVVVAKFCAEIFRGCLVFVACSCTWIVGLVLAILPFFSNQLDLYRHNSVCTPLPLHKGDFIVWPNFFGVIVALNLILSLIADLFYAGTVFSISVCISDHSVQTKTREKTIVRRLTLLLVTKTLSCLLLGVIGVTTQMEMSYPLDVISGLTLLVCPLNSSTNPVLYAISIHREARRKSQRLRLLKLLQSPCQKTQKKYVLSCINTT